MAQYITFPDIKPVGASMAEGFENAYNRQKNLEAEQMRYDMQTAAKMKLADLMSNLKSKQRLTEIQQSEPAFKKLLGEEQGAAVARMHPTVQSSYMKDWMNRQAFDEIQQKLQQNPDISKMMQSLGQTGYNQPIQPTQPQQFAGTPVNQEDVVNRSFTKPTPPSPIAPPGTRQDIYSRTIYPQLQKDYATALKNYQFDQKREDDFRRYEDTKATKTQENLKDYLKTESHNAQIYEKEKADLTRVYTLFQDFKSRYPWASTTHVSDLFESYWNQDPGIREASALLDKYAVYESSIEGIGAVGKGSKYRTELIKGSKPNFQMPVSAFENALKSSMNHIEEEIDKFKYITRQKDPKTKRYPADLPVLAASYQLSKTDPRIAEKMAQEDPESFPQLFDVGVVHENDDGSHSELQLVNGIKKWVRV